MGFVCACVSSCVCFEILNPNFPTEYKVQLGNQTFPNYIKKLKLSRKELIMCLRLELNIVISKLEQDDSCYSLTCLVEV